MARPRVHARGNDQPDHLAGRQPHARSATPSTVFPEQRRRAPARRPRHAGLELAHLPATTPTATPTSCTTASSRSAGTATASRAPCTTAASARRRRCRRCTSAGSPGRDRRRASTSTPATARAERAAARPSTSTASCCRGPSRSPRSARCGLFVARPRRAPRPSTRDILGFDARAKRRTYAAHRCVFLRSNTEHHSLAPLPDGAARASSASARTPPAWRSASSWPTTASSRTPSTFLREERRHASTRLPPELYPGIDYAAHAFDPDGHCIQLYYYMEQVGWDGQPVSGARNAQGAERIDTWPETRRARADTFAGEPFLGPWG